MKTDMSPQAVTNRMVALDQLWELTVALKSSKVEKVPSEPLDKESTEKTSQRDENK